MSELNPVADGDNLVESAIETVEEFFAPRPGGLVDRHRQERARKEAEAQVAANEAERIEEHAYRAVKTAPVQPESFSVNLVTIPAGGTAMILPLSPYRNRASIVVVTPASTIVLGKDASQVTGGAGFPILSPAGAPSSPFQVIARAQLWAFSATAVTVAILAEINAPEK